jgi:hypothetical protein
MLNIEGILNILKISSDNNFRIQNGGLNLTMNKKKCLFLVFLIISGLFLVFLIFYPKSYHKEIIFLGTIISFIINLLLFSLERYRETIKTKKFSMKINFFEALLITSLILSLSAISGVIIYDNYLAPKPEWSIGIYHSESYEPINFSGKNFNNPVLTRADISDIKAEFVADPFLIHENNTFYLFFEVFNSITAQGDIGLAESNNGIDWSYKKIVLDESFHLSYPCVFEYKNEYYMIPETHAVRAIRLYKADNFPYNWSLIKTIVSGRNFADSTIFYFNSTWWLFTETDNNDVLRLYYCDSLLGLWMEHPTSPIISGDSNITRPAGNVLIFNNRIFRFAQDDYPNYGNQIWEFEITALTKQDYKEKRIDNKPFLKGYDYWNERGIHHISICRIANNSWIAAIDGHGFP